MFHYDTDIVEKILKFPLLVDWNIFIRNNSLCKINYCIMLFRTKEKLQVGKELICMNSVYCCGTPVRKSD